MKAVIFLIIIIMVCGCAVIISDDDDVKMFGIREEEGLDTLERIEQKSAEEKREIKWFERKQ